MPPLSERGPLLSFIEYLPAKLFYLPLMIAWPYYAIRYGGLPLPATANPGIPLGGWCGESKTALFDSLGETGRAYVAPFTTVTAGDTVEAVARALAKAELSFPIVAKPDIGRNGRGVKMVRTEEELVTYLMKFPPTVRIVLQRFIQDEGEAGVFYVRKPSEIKGRITSLTLKYFPKVTGDGVHTLRELILADARARALSELYFRRNAHDLDTVIPKAATRALVSVGNHVRGAIFADGASHITDKMTEVFDRICKEAEIFFVRFDVRFTDIHALEQGKSFWILEYNGTGSEPTHIYDRQISLLSAYQALLAHWRLSFAIGAENVARGVRRVTAREVISTAFNEEKLLESYPDEE